MVIFVSKRFGRVKSRRYPVLLWIGLILVYFDKRIWNCWNIILYWDNVIQIRVNVYKRPSNKWMLWIFLLIFDSVKMATPDGNLKWRPCFYGEHLCKKAFCHSNVWESRGIPATFCIIMPILLQNILHKGYSLYNKIAGYLNIRRNHL